MRYCQVHRRAWLPPGYDLRQRRTMLGAWHQLAPWTLAIAQTYARVFGCSGQVQVQQVCCDVCTAEKDLYTLEETHD